jgi:regulation of enolase protein 1 (concanavalin A-like superfamily)
MTCVRCTGRASCVSLLVTFLIFTVSAANAQTLPTPWTSRDIGSPAIVGSALYNLGTFAVNAGGTDIWGTSDQFRFVYQPVSGDVEITARVDSLIMADPWSKAGVMIRGSLTAGSAHGFSLVSSSNGVAFQRRLVDNGTTTPGSGPSVTLPRWLRLVRAGTRLTAYTSTDGTTWTTIGSDTITLGASAYVGLAVTSHNALLQTTALFSQVTVRPLAPQAVPAPQQTADIGAPAIAGSATYSAGSYTIKAAGADIWGTADQFRYVYQPMTGDVDIKVRVASITMAHAWSKVGVMVREDLTAGSRHATALTSAGNGYAFQRRIDPNGYTTHTSGGSGAPPGWVRLVRTGDRFEAFRSADGNTWTSMGTDTVPMASAVYVGIAVTSHNVTTATTAMVDSLKVTGSAAAPNQPPAVSITSPVSGSTFSAPASVALTASATDSDGTIARVDFYNGSTLLGSDTASPYSFSWASVPAGTYSVKAIAYDTAGASTTSATISITVLTGTTMPPTKVVFQASTDHAILVLSYGLDVFANGANPSTATPIATSNLGKPTPDANNDITVDRATFFSALAAGNYIATVSAIGSGGSSRSLQAAFTR